MFAPSYIASLASTVIPGILGLLLSLAGLAWTIFLIYTVANDPKRQGFHDHYAHSVDQADRPDRLIPLHSATEAAPAGRGLFDSRRGRYSGRDHEPRDWDAPPTTPSRTPGPLGRGGRRPPRGAPGGRRADPRRGLRQRPRHGAPAGSCPRGRVVAVDGSPAMLGRRGSASPGSAIGSSSSRRTCGPAPRSRPGRRDPLDRHVPLDPDHAALYRHLAAVTRPAASSSPSTAASATRPRCGPCSRRSATAGRATSSSPGRTRRAAGWRLRAGRTSSRAPAGADPLRAR